MTTPKNKYSKDGFELGASKIPIIVLGQNDFGSTREDIRKNFVEIRSNPDVIQLENKKNQNAKDRGNYLEDGIAHWVSDTLDFLCEGEISVSFTKPKDAFRLPKYKMAASLDGVLEVHGGSIQYDDQQTGKTLTLSGKGVCEIKTQ